jgi:PAS domain S-box-containing protein
MLVGAVALLLAYLSGRRITRPIQELTVTAGAVREGDLSARVDVAGEDEVGQLGETFNEMTESLLRFTDDLRRAAHQEHDLRERIETIINSMADGLVAVDGDLNVLAFNPEAERITGVSADEAVGKAVDSVIAAEDAHGERVELPISTLSEGSLADVFVKPRDGDRVPVAVTSAVLRGEEEEITGGVAVIRDVTREREIERMKTEFLSNISHELRTPLTPIKGYAELLGRKEIPFTKTKQFVTGILDSTGRLERIVELLVDFSAMEAGRLVRRAGPVDMGEMLSAVAERWEPRAPKHRLVTEVPDGETLQVVGDERLLRRSLDEVLDNAVKFSPNGGAIRLAARAAVGGNGAAGTAMVEVSVTDQGIGIPEEDLTKIFSDFQQLDGSETRAYGGLGLGLAFVRRIVEAHQGVLRVDSEPDSGTRLTISIPAAEQTQPEAERPAEEVKD